MSWSYSGDPTVSRKDEIRFLIGDTNSDVDEQLLSDEEINYALVLYPASDDKRTQPLMAALICAEAIWTYFNRQADERLPPVNFEFASRAKNYKAKVDDLRLTVIRRGGLMPYVGGISVLDKEGNITNEDRTKPDFFRKVNDNNSTIASTTINLLDLD